MCVLIFSAAFETFPILRKIRREYYHNLTRFIMSITRYMCQIWLKVRFSRQIFEKYPNTNFHENLSNVVIWRRKDSQPERRTDMTRLILAFRSFSNEPNNALSFSASCGQRCCPDWDLSRPTNTARCRTYSLYLCYFVLLCVTSSVQKQVSTEIQKFSHYSLSIDNDLSEFCYTTDRRTCLSSKVSHFFLSLLVYELEFKLQAMKLIRSVTDRVDLHYTLTLSSYLRQNTGFNIHNHQQMNYILWNGRYLLLQTCT